MSKTLFIFFTLLIFSSCVREDFVQTTLIISYKRQDKSTSSKIWLNIYNPRTRFYRSIILLPEQNTTSITLPNADNYVIYGLSFVTEYDGGNALISEKYFKKTVSLQEGGTRLISLDMAKENLRLLAGEDFIGEDGTPVKLIVNPCSDNGINNCRSGYDFGYSGVGSIRIKFFQYFPTPESSAPFRQDQMFWMSQCIPGEENNFFDPMIKIPSSSGVGAPFNMRLEVFYDYECKEHIPVEDSMSQNSFFGVPNAPEGSKGPWLKVVDYSGELASLTFIADKLANNNQCWEDVNCQSGLCASDEYTTKKFCISD